MEALAQIRLAYVQISASSAGSSEDPASRLRRPAARLTERRPDQSGWSEKGGSDEACSVPTDQPELSALSVTTVTPIASSSSQVTRCRSERDPRPLGDTALTAGDGRAVEGEHRAVIGMDLPSPAPRRNASPCPTGALWRKSLRADRASRRNQWTIFESASSITSDAPRSFNAGMRTFT